MSALLCGCSTTQELNDGASFEGLKNFYVENSSGGDSFLGNSETPGGKPHR
ncbi:MAG: hypothetical protein ACLUKN_07910 [Bacilli bacterium]